MSKYPSTRLRLVPLPIATRWGGTLMGPFLIEDARLAAVPAHLDLALRRFAGPGRVQLVDDQAVGLDALDDPDRRERGIAGQRGLADRLGRSGEVDVALGLDDTPALALG